MTTAPIESIVWSIWTPDSRHIGLSHAVGTSIVFVDARPGRSRPGHGSWLRRQVVPVPAAHRDRRSWSVPTRTVTRACTSWTRPARTSIRSGRRRLRTTTIWLTRRTALTEARSSSRAAVQVELRQWLLPAVGHERPTAPMPTSSRDDRVINAWEGVPSVSPDGRWVAFWRVAGGGHASVVAGRRDRTGDSGRPGPERHASTSSGPRFHQAHHHPAGRCRCRSPVHRRSDNGKWTTSDGRHGHLDQQRLAP